MNTNKLCLLIFIFAFSLRLGYIFKTSWVLNVGPRLHVSSSNRSVFDSSDVNIYESLAHSLVTGSGIGVPFHPPLLVFFLAFFYKLFGYNPLLPKLFFAVLSSFASVFIFLLGRLLFGKFTALLAALLSAASFNLLILCGANNTEALYCFFLAGFFYFLIKNINKPTLTGSVVLGFFAGFALLTRSEFALILVSTFLLESLYYKSKTPHSLRLFLVPYCVSLILLVPLVVRNYFYMGEYNKSVVGDPLSRFVPLTLNGPINFYIGNNPTANGGFNVDFLKSSRNAALSFSDASSMDYVVHGYKKGFSFILENPSLALEIVKKKAIRFFDAFSGGYFLINYPGGFPGERASTADIYTSDNKIMIYLHILLLLPGMFISLRLFRPPERVLLVPIVVPFFLSIVFFGLARAVTPYLYFYFLFFAVSCTEFLDIVLGRMGLYCGNRKKTEKLMITAVTAAFALLVCISIFGKNYRYTEFSGLPSMPIRVESVMD